MRCVLTLAEWRARMKLSRARAAALLGVDRGAYTRYEADGIAPLVVRLAAAAVLNGLPALRSGR
jgi:transcriptional regulator with XRE-family HTH domain